MNRMKLRLTYPGNMMLTKVEDVETGRVLPIRAFSVQASIDRPGEVVLVLEVVDFELNIETDKVEYITRIE